MFQDVRLLSSGKPAQHTAEVETDLDKAEGMIRYLFNDVQLLKDGRHLQAEQMYRRSEMTVPFVLHYSELKHFIESKSSSKSFVDTE